MPRGFCRSKTSSRLQHGIVLLHPPRFGTYRLFNCTKTSCVQICCVRTSRVGKNGVWEKAVKESVDPHRARTYGQQFAALLSDYFKSISREQARVLAALFSGSRALSE